MIFTRDVTEHVPNGTFFFETYSPLGIWVSLNLTKVEMRENQVSIKILLIILYRNFDV